LNTAAYRCPSTQTPRRSRWQPPPDRQSANVVSVVSNESSVRKSQAGARFVSLPGQLPSRRTFPIESLASAGPHIQHDTLSILMAGVTEEMRPLSNIYKSLRAFSLLRR